MTNTKTNTFSFAGLELRSVTIEGKPWFVAVDACRMLGLTANNTTQHVRHLAEAEKTLNPIKGNRSGSGSGAKHVLMISESGLYALVMSSDKPQAREFQNWVTGTVLPAIRETACTSRASPHDREGRITSRISHLDGLAVSMGPSLGEGRPPQAVGEDWRDDATAWTKRPNGWREAG